MANELTCDGLIWLGPLFGFEFCFVLFTLTLKKASKTDLIGHGKPIAYRLRYYIWPKRWVKV